ncbi:MAG TPA: type II toxin-antitoxin system RelE/ParE family toxin [Deltaproteobacteria bacterium]|jgi:hypothetical protein|nr:type II toxin-antitoxin system RelE/ParE family toxin [Deltaproteobacteria bacterium]HOI05686.1 type II toxin-antitoxin system RelE/ParE family toxin [Deltaproteobacteria bacterium]
MGIMEYISRDSPAAVYEQLKEIQDKSIVPLFFSRQGRILPELQEQGIIQYRELIVAPWRIISRISKNSVYVLSVLDARQNVEDILLKRFIGTTL